MRANTIAVEPGVELAGYRIEGLAGSGGMGTVYLATQVALGRPVALKLIAHEHGSDPVFRERFARESRLAALIDHPNVVPVYEAGETDGLLYIAMRFVPGTDLRALIARERLEPARAVAIVGQVAAALDAAHRRGLVHRDVKPANVLITTEGGMEHVYLTDFGLTRRTAAHSALTEVGMFVGTLDYVPPEQIRGEATDARADVYALGCVLYHALTGTVPFDRDSDVATIQAHLNDPPPRMSGAAASLDAVVARALAKDPAERFPSAGDLARAAREAVHGAGPPPAPSIAAPAPPSRAPAPASAPLVPASPSAPASAPPSPWPRRRLIVLGAALPTVLVAGIAAAALSAAGVLPGTGDGPAPPVATVPVASATPVATATPTPEPPAQPAVAATIPVGRGPDGLVVDRRRVFVANADDGTLTRIDAGSNRVDGEPVAVGANPDGVVAAQGAVWVTLTDEDQVQRLEALPDPVPSARIGVGDLPQGISLGKQLVWVANSGTGTVNRIDRASPALVGGPIGVGAQPTGIFVGRRTVWVTNRGDDTVQRIDPATAQPVGDPIPVGDAPHGVVETRDDVWVANSRDGTVTRLDRVTGEVVGEPIRVGREPRELTAGLGFVWVANTGAGSVSRIDLATGRVAGSPIPVGRRPLGIDVGAGSVWVANSGDDTVTRIRP
jgi:DNA-binding beta-propeller fold protein YncE